MYSEEKSEVRRKVLKAFAELRKQGFLARGNFLCCQNCGGFEMTEMAELRIRNKKKVNGCVFWHRQDEQTFWERGSLYIAYGDMDSSELGKIGLPSVEVGKAVVKALEEQGVNVSWDGNEGTRILVSVEPIKETVGR